MYDKEKSGIKPNTIRKIEFTDERWTILMNHLLGHYKEGWIHIKNSKSGEVFHREITDVSIWDGIFIISWNHPNSNSENKEVQNGE